MVKTNSKSNRSVLVNVDKGFVWLICFGAVGGPTKRMRAGVATVNFCPLHRSYANDLDIRLTALKLGRVKQGNEYISKERGRWEKQITTCK